MKCRYCDEKIELHYFPSMNDHLKLTQTCFTCTFWINKIPNRTNIRTVIYRGEHYNIGKGGGKAEYRGFAGRKWKIVFKGNHNLADEEDKRRDLEHNIIQSVVYTDDLWGQGKIPERFRKFLPDNAIELVAIG